MKKVARIVGLLIIIIILFTSITFAYQNEPDSFRGWRWGAPYEQVQDELVLLSSETVNGTDFKVTKYTRKNDVMRLGNAELSKLYYCFFDGNLYFVFIEFDGRQNFLNLRDDMFKNFGNVPDSNATYSYAGKILEYKWTEPITENRLYNGLTDMSLTFDTNLDWGCLTICSLQQKRVYWKKVDAARLKTSGW